MTIKKDSPGDDRGTPVSFVLDSGATRHMSRNPQLFHSWYPYDRAATVLTSTGEALTALGEGDIYLYPLHPASAPPVRITRALYVPHLSYNLLSVSSMDKKGLEIVIRRHSFSILDDTSILATGTKIGEQYILTGTPRRPTLQHEAHVTGTTQTEEELSCLRQEPPDWPTVDKLPIPARALWIKAMRRELDSFDTNNTWHVATPPPEALIIKTRWTYKLKRNPDGHPTKIRARLVAKGFQQLYGLHYDAVYAPVVKPQTIRVLLTMAATLGLHVIHIDFESAFLNGHLQEKIYVSHPPGPPELGDPGRVYLLDAAIYGLRQAALAWHSSISNALTQLGFSPTEPDNCLFTNSSETNPTFIIIHVDDLLIVSQKVEYIQGVIKQLSQNFSLKDLGEVSCYLGMHLARKNLDQPYSLSQRDKIINLYESLKGEELYPVHTPMLRDYLVNKREDSSPPLSSPLKYQSVMGTLLYIANNSRPDTTLAVGLLGRSAHSPTELDWAALIRVVSYLKCTKNVSLVLGGLDSCSLKTYSDADWAGDPQSRRSTSGNCHYLRGSLISWSARRQSCVTLSTAEAEYVAAVDAAKETSWLIRLLTSLKFPISLPVTFLLDNQSAIAIASSHKMGRRTKHIEIRVHYLKDLIDSGKVTLTHCPTSRMAADLFTKPLARPSFDTLKAMMGLQESPISGLTE